MISTFIDRLGAAYPGGLSTAAELAALAAPLLLFALGVWLAAGLGEWLIDWSERRRTERAKRLRYRTADARQIERDIDQLWRSMPPDASGASWEPWRDTMPPADAAPRRRAGPPTVLQFPSQDAQRRRQS